MKAPGKFKFGEWLPDLPALDNPGLTECKNILKFGHIYEPYFALSGAGFTPGSATAINGARRWTGLYGTAVYVSIVSGGHNKLYVGTGSGSSWGDVTGSAMGTVANPALFAQYNEYVITCNGADITKYVLLSGSYGTTAFAQLTGAYGDAPIAGCVGVINQFVLLGNIPSAAPYAVRWSGINAPLNWPTPLTADAIAQQSGIQYLEPDLGTVRGISQGDQWGLILLDGGLVRAIYNGGSTVFGFDTIYRGKGPISESAWIKVGPLVYFASLAGFYSTDGVNVTPIGRNKVDRYFLFALDTGFPNQVRCGVHWTKRLIYWTFANVGNSGINNEMLIYNIDDGGWTHVFDGVEYFVFGEEPTYSLLGQVEAFENVTHKCGVFNGAIPTAVLTTAEAELNPGGKAFVTGFRPQCGPASAVSVRVGYRDNQGDSVSFSAADTPDAFTGSCNFMIDSRYHRAEISLSGNFAQAIGGEFEAGPSSGI